MNVTLLSMDDLTDPEIKKIIINNNLTNLSQQQSDIVLTNAHIPLASCEDRGKSLMAFSTAHLCTEKIPAASNDLAYRLVIPPRDANKIALSNMRTQKNAGSNCYTIGEFGEFPQNPASAQTEQDIQRIYYANNVSKLTTTGQTYHIPSYNNIVSCPEFIYQNKKYVIYDGKLTEVAPITWIRVQSTGMLVSEKILFANALFNAPDNTSIYFNGTTIHNYLENYFSKEFINQKWQANIRANAQQTTTSQNQTTSNQQSAGAKTASNQQSAGAKTASNTQSANTNTQQSAGAKTASDTGRSSASSARPNNTKQSRTTQKSSSKVTIDKHPMSTRDQINFYVQNGMSFMLHGPSGIGKTARVEQVDPNLTAVPLYNGVLPEDIVGKVIYPSGRIEAASSENIGSGIWVAPDWYNELQKKCQAEPDKMHVLFIDEVTNARPTTQSLIFHITLKKSITPSKGQLPENAVVVLAGNSVEESGAAYNMPEPLFRRMCGHIYLDINIPEWLEWGAERDMHYPDENRRNIHPVVSSFIAAHGKKVFYSEYDEEDPAKTAVDPRGWKQVSDIIYNNRGVIRRELLENKIGPELTDKFLLHLQNPKAAQIYDAGMLNDIPIPTTLDGKLDLAYRLLEINERDIPKVRKFIQEKLGKEVLSMYDSMLIKEKPERALNKSMWQNLHIDGGR